MSKNDPVLRIGFAFTMFAVVVCIAPVILMILVSVTRNWQQGVFRTGFTTEWIGSGLTSMAPYLANSLHLASRVLITNILIGFPTAWALARHQFPGRQILRATTSLPIAVPGIAVALALTVSFPQIRGSGWLLFGSHVIYTLPFFVGTLVPVLQRVALIEMEKVARTLGASRMRVFGTITIPQVWLSLAAASVIAFTLSMGEFNVSFFLVTPLEKTLPVELYSAYITDRLEVAAANTVWFFFFVLPAAIIIELFGGSKWGQA